MALNRLSASFTGLLNSGDVRIDYDWFVRLLALLEARISPLEGKGGEIDAAIAAMRQFALNQINEVLSPVINDFKEIQENGFLIAHSGSEGTLGIDNVLTLVVGDDTERRLFTPSPFIILTREDNPDDLGVARLISYERDFGVVTSQVITFSGAPGPHSDWVIGALAGATTAQVVMLEQMAAALAEIQEIQTEVGADNAATLLGVQTNNAATLQAIQQNNLSAVQLIDEDRQTIAADKTTAVGAKNDAVSAKDLAQKWASEALDVVVAGGKFSAMHYALKAAASAAAAALFDTASYYTKTAMDTLLGAKISTSQRGISNGVAPLDGNIRVPEANIFGRTLRVGDVLRTTIAPDAKFLPCDGSKYLKTAYPDLAAAFPLFPIWDTESGYIGAAGTVDQAFSITAIGGDYALSIGTTAGIIINMKTGARFALNNAGVDTNKIARCATFADGLFYIVYAYSGVNYIFSLDPVTRVFTAVGHNLPSISTNAPRLIYKFGAYWFVIFAGTLARGTSLTTMATVPTMNTLLYDIGEPTADGRMYALVGTATANPALYRSTDWGATWTSIVGTIAAGYGYSPPSADNIRQAKRLGAFTYMRTKSASTGSGGIVFKIGDDDSVTAMGNYDDIGSPSSPAFREVGDYLYVGNQVSGLLVDKQGRKLVMADLIAAIGNPRGLLDFANSLTNVFHPTYGIAIFNRTTSVNFVFSQHNYDTEFRTPKISSFSEKFHIKAVA